MWGRKSRPVFIYGERVRVTEGFYTGQIGTVIRESYDEANYFVTLDSLPSDSQSLWFRPSWLQRLDEDAQPEHIRKILV